MTSTSQQPAKQLLLAYLIAPEEHRVSKQLAMWAWAVFEFPKDASTKHAKAEVRERRRALLKMATQGPRLPQPFQHLHALQELLWNYSLDTTEEEKAKCEMLCAAYLKDSWQRWDPTDFCGCLGHAPFEQSPVGRLRREGASTSVEKGRPSLVDLALAVDVLRDLPEEEYDYAVAAALASPPKSAMHANVIHLPHGSYTVDALDRVFQVMKLMFESNPVQFWNYVHPPEPPRDDDCIQQVAGDLDLLSHWKQDLASLRKFAEACIWRAHRWYELRDQGLVEDVMMALRNLRSLSRNGRISTLTACAFTVNVLKFFFRVAVKLHYVCKEEGQQSLTAGKWPVAESDIILELEAFEQELFRSRYPGRGFFQRLPHLLLGQPWGKVYPELRAIVASKGRPLNALLQKEFDQALLLGLLPSSCHEALRLLIEQMQSIHKGATEDLLSNSLACPSSDSFSNLLQFCDETTRATWSDEEATKALQILCENQLKFSFRFPFTGSPRFEQLQRSLAAHISGVVLLYYPHSRLTFIEHPVEDPFELRVLQRNHSRIFRCLPVERRELREEEQQELLAVLRGHGLVCWMTNLFVTVARKVSLASEGIKFIADKFSHHRSFSLKELPVEDLQTSQDHWIEAILEALPVMQGPPNWQRTGLSLPEKLRAVLFVPRTRQKQGDVWHLATSHLRNKRLLQLLADSNVPTFMQDAVGNKTYYRWLKNKIFVPCYCSGLILPHDWLKADEDVLRRCIKDHPKQLRLLLQGARGVLFSDHPSSLVHQEQVCLLPLGLSKQEALLKVLQKYGVALYAWSVNSAFSPAPGVQMLKIEDMFVPGENVYNSMAFHRDSPEEAQAVRLHVERQLQQFAPRAGDFRRLCPPVEPGKARAALVVTRSEHDLRFHCSLFSSSSVHLPTVLLYAGGSTEARRLVATDVRRVHSSLCIGSESCSRRACREVKGVPMAVVCGHCEPWEDATGDTGSLACAWCQYTDQETGLACQKPAAKKLKSRLGCNVYPFIFCADHATLRSTPAEDLARCHVGDGGPVLYEEVPGTLSVRRPGTYPLSYHLPNTKDMHISEPTVSDACLEVQSLLKQAVCLWMHDNRDWLLSVKVLICLRRSTQELLDACLAEVFVGHRMVPSTLALETQTTAEVLANQSSLLHTLGSADLLRMLTQDVERLRWLSNPEETDAHDMLWEEIGELPRSESPSARGLETLDASPPGLSALDSEVLKLQTTHCSPVERRQVMQSLQQYLTLVDDFFDVPACKLSVSFVRPLCGKKTQQWSESVGLGWCFVQMAMVEAHESWKKSRGASSSWAQAMLRVLETRTDRLRLRAAWRFVPQLPSFLAAESNVCCSTWGKVLPRLFFDRDADAAKQELLRVNACLNELAKLYRLRNSATVASGVLLSVGEALVASLAALNEASVTPDAFVRLIVAPRIHMIEDFEKALYVIFQKPGEDEGSEKPVALALHVSLLAQAFFWGHKMRHILVKKLEATQAEFDEMHLSRSERTLKLKNSFTASSPSLGASARGQARGHGSAGRSAQNKSKARPRPSPGGQLLLGLAKLDKSLNASCTSDRGASSVRKGLQSSSSKMKTGKTMPPETAPCTKRRKMNA